jgi:probable O-glycosylation ligase (exosortase A-associated)
MRDLMLLGFVLMYIALAFRSPFVSYLVWAWTAMVFPTSYMYGFMTGSRLNLVFAVLTVVLLAVNRQKLKSFELNRTTVLLLLFIVHGSLCAALALPGNAINATYYEIFLKSVVLALLLPVVVSDRLRLHAFLLVVVLGVGFIGGIDGLRVVATAGGHKNQGMEVGMFSDNNHFAAGIVMFVPLAMYVAQHSGHKLVRWVAWSIFVLCVFSILSSRSRGGFVALLVVGLCVLIVSRQRFRNAVIAVILGFVFVAYAPDDVMQRLDTIDTAKTEDGSFRERLMAWRVSSAVALDNPIFGGGFHAIQNRGIWMRYSLDPGLFARVDTPDPSQSLFARAAHSIYFEVMGDMGFVGLAIFLALLFNAFFTLYWLGIRVRKDPRLRWARDLAFTLFTCLAGYSVAGAAVSLAYLEFFYILLLLVEVLRRLVAQQLAEQTAADAGAADLSTGAVPQLGTRGSERQ